MPKLRKQKHTTFLTRY